MVGTRDSHVLVLKQTSGTQLAVAQQIGASPITGIALYEDNTAVVTAAFDSSTNLVHFALLAGSIANDGMTGKHGVLSSLHKTGIAVDRMWHVEHPCVP